MKKCRKCETEKPLIEYYKHKEMFDGYLNICKECVKNRVTNHRVENIDKIREYDRNRPNAKERSIKHCERVKNLSDDKKSQYKLTRDKWESKGLSKNKKTVNCYLENAVRDNRIVKKDYCEHCEVKNVPLDGHHPSYLKPLDVIWLCKKCHGAEHKRLNAIERGST